jgi:hypothetical protein
MTEVEACNEFNIALQAKEAQVLVETNVQQSFNPVTTQMPSLINFEEWQQLCAPMYRFQVYNPATYLWQNWNEAQRSIMTNFMSSEYPSSSSFW